MNLMLRGSAVESCTDVCLCLLRRERITGLG